MRWLNRSVATLNVTLQVLVLYRLHLIIETLVKKN